MKLLVQPDDGVTPIIKGIETAKETIDILIFRFGHRDVESALANAVRRGIVVRALIAHTNRGGESSLRALEQRLLAAGVIVARTAGDLLRYHGKLMVIDSRELYLLAYNFTYLDIDRSRSFGIVARQRKLVQEAMKLFEADSTKQPYSPGVRGFLVSPQNARPELALFIKRAKKELLIYDPSVTDSEMLRLLQARAKSGVSVRLIGRAKLGAGISVRKFSRMRLHARSIIRDQQDVFIGSQSLRAEELDTRREVGLIFHDPRIADRLVNLFNEDWDLAEVRAAATAPDKSLPARKIAKKVAKAITNDLSPVAPVVNGVVKELAADGLDVEVNPDTIQDAVKDAVKSAVKEAVLQAVDEAGPQEPTKEGG